MIKRMKMVLSLVCLLCAGSLWAAETKIVFNDGAALSSYGIALPAASAGTNLAGTTISVDGLMVSFSDGSTPTRIWNSGGNYTLRVYNGGGVTIAGEGITRIVVQANNPNQLTANVGSYTAGVWTGSANSVTFTGGKVQISSLTVTHTAAPKEPVVSGLSELNALEDGTPATLMLTDDANCRVLYAADGDAYLRDGSGAVKLAGCASPRRFRYNRHVVGTLRGVKTAHGFDATAATRFDGLLVADPVQEANTAPVVVKVEDMKNHLFDWVTLERATMNGSKAADGTGSVAVGDALNVEDMPALTDGMEVQISGLVLPYGDGIMLAPMGQEAQDRALNPSQPFAESFPAVKVLTGIRSADASAEVMDTLYDLGGRQVPEPVQRGVYVLKGKKIRK